MSSALFNLRMRAAMPNGRLSPELQMALTQLAAAIDGTGSKQITLVTQDELTPVSTSPTIQEDFAPLSVNATSEDFSPV